MSKHRDNFFDVSVHHPEIKKCLSGKNEDEILKIFKSLGYSENKQFKRQYPIGNKFVLDFAFPELQVCVEVDGPDHLSKKKRSMDKKRDTYLHESGWVIIRVPDHKFKENPFFFKYVIEDVVKFRTQEFEEGKIIKLPPSDFKDE